MGDVNELETERNKTMANLPGSIKNLNTLLGEQLAEGGGGGGFTSAKVTVIGKASTIFWGSDQNNITNKPIYGLLEYGGHFNSYQNFGSEQAGDTTYDVYILETGEEFPAFQFNVDDGEIVTVSGNCTLVNPSAGIYVVLFTGDCTITIS